MLTTGAMLAQRRGKRLGALARAAVGVADRHDLLHALLLELLGEADSGDSHRRATTFEQALRGVADGHVALGGVRVRAEHDHVRALALGQRGQSLRRRAVDDHVALGRGYAEELHPVVKDALGLDPRDLLAHAVGLGVVPDVSQRHLATGATEELTQSDGVLLVGGAVIGNDDLG